MRAQESPEERVVLDATDLTANSLNGRYPPLEPTSSSESGGSNQLSPAVSNFQITPSLLSRNQSPNSVSTGVVEYGIATSTAIQSVINPHVGVDTEHADDSIGKYILNAPVMTKIPRQSSILNNNQAQHRSPSRSSGQSSAGSKTNRSMLRGRQAMSVRGRQSLFMVSTRRDSQGSAQKEDVSSSLSLGIPSDLFIERARTKDLFEEHFTDEGAHCTSSKYGYNIRESFEARDVIMGQQGSSKPKNKPGGLLNNRSTSTTAGQSGPVREVNLELATLGTISTKIGHPASIMRLHTRTPTHPPRSSSLPKTPSPPQASGLGSDVKNEIGPNGRRLPVPNTQTDKISSSESGKEAPPASRLSLFYRQTAASSARASFNAKKISEPRTSHIPQSRTLASLSDVGKGMKNFGKKVGKIIPSRRSIVVEATSDEILIINTENSNGPRRQASRLLTTYNNSGMHESSDEYPHHFVANGDGFIEPEPGDRDVPEGTEKQKKDWRKASRNRVHDSETDRYIRFSGQDDGSSDDSDDERPPSRRGIRVGPDGHYVEDAVEDVSDEGTDNTTNFPPNEDDELPPTRRASVESNVPADGTENNVADDGVENQVATGGLISDARFDQLISETDFQARHLLSYAMTLGESRPRSLMIESATHLSEGLMHVRRARIEVVRVNQLVEEITVILAANAHRMSVIMREISTPAPERPA